jgi:hypothetical protein
VAEVCSLVLHLLILFSFSFFYSALIVEKLTAEDVQVGNCAYVSVNYFLFPLDNSKSPSFSTARGDGMIL